MSDIENWDEATVQTMIANQVTENLQLEFKQSDALGRSDGKKREISKDVSAFENSAGGIILYGVAENGHVPTHVDGGTDANDLSKEWLEQVLQSNIHPRISGISIKQIPVSASPGRVLYAVEIPQSTVQAPHQAADHRYYKRFNFQSCPMEDYEIRDIMRRSATPDLYLDIQSNATSVSGSFTSLSTSLRISVGNHASEPALYALIRIFIDPGLAPTRWGEFQHVGSITIDGRDILVGRTIWVAPPRLPIFKEAVLPLGDPMGITLPGQFVGDTCRYKLGYEILAPGCSVTKYGWLVCEGGHIWCELD
jgi:hypothetical protein